MRHAFAICLPMVAALLQQPAKPNPPVKLPDSEVFKEAGAKILSGEQIMDPPISGRNLWLISNEKERRVIVRGTICRREGPLEEFMCLKNTKEHESIVTADIHPRNLHAMLMLAGAKAGHPARFQPEFQPPAGDKIEVLVEWKQGKQTRRVKAQDMIRDVKTKKAMTFDFVFAGSQEVEVPDSKEPFYLANEGDIISVSNFISSLIDIAVQSSSVDVEHLFEPFTDQIPPLDSEVFVILRAVPAAKPKAAPPAAPEKPSAPAAKRPTEKL